MKTKQTLILLNFKRYATLFNVTQKDTTKGNPLTRIQVKKAGVYAFYAMRRNDNIDCRDSYCKIDFPFGKRLGKVRSVPLIKRKLSK